MIEIHRFFRSGFREVPELVRNVADGDVTHATAVAGQLNLLSVTLHGHHEGEDSHLWPMLTDRVPGCVDHVERMKAQHSKMLVQLEKLDAALPAWTASGSTSDAAPVLSAAEGINQALEEHLGDEEQNVVPIMETTLTPSEVEWFAEHGRKSTPKGQTWNMLGGILRGQPDGGDAWQQKNLPGFVRFLWRRVGAPKYKRYRATLEGSAQG